MSLLWGQHALKVVLNLPIKTGTAVTITGINELRNKVQKLQITSSCLNSRIRMIIDCS